MPKPGQPRFNHVAMSVPGDLLDAQGRADIAAFYDEVFGWKELPTETVDREKLVLSAYTFDQFVFLIADDPAMPTPRLDPFGMGVATIEELDEFYEKAKRYKEKDASADLIDEKAEQHPG